MRVGSCLAGNCSSESATVRERGAAATNRLAVKADAALLPGDDATPGSGDMRVFVNRKAAARDAALVFETGYAARAMLGTIGSDDFSLEGVRALTALNLDGVGPALRGGWRET